MEAANYSDKELVLYILKNGQSNAFEILYSRHLEKVRRQCLTLVRNREVADDLVQDIFVKILEKLGQYRQESAFTTWIYSITYNHCIEYLRKNKRIFFEEWENQIDLPEAVEEAELQEIMESKAERMGLILEMMKPSDKAILIMKYQEGMKIQEIMKILVIEGESAAKMKINRAKKRFQGLYLGMFGSLA